MKSSQKGSVAVWTIAVLVVVIIFAGIYVYSIKSQNLPKDIISADTSSVTESTVPTQTSQSSTPNLNTKTGWTAQLISKSSDFENPISIYFTADSKNQICSANIFLLNPFDQELKAVITQPLSADFKIIESDGTQSPAFITWTTNMSLKAPIFKGTFSFKLVKTSTGLTKVPEATVIYIDKNGNQTPPGLHDVINNPLPQSKCAAS